MPFVSVVIPSYNHERFLHDAIQSVLSQEGIELELVIIDDGSKDRSWEIIQAAARADSRVKAYAQSNQGAHAAINAGLRQCRGEFVAILNSDDRFLPRRLATLVDLASTGLDFVATGLRVIDGNSAAITEGPWLDEYARMRATAHSAGLWNALVERNFTVSTSNFFFRTSLLAEVGPIRPLRYNMDWDWALRAYERGPERFAWRDDLVLLEYRIHGANTILDGLPVSAIEANHVLFAALKRHYQVPGTALSAVRKHYRLLRRQQVHTIASKRDAFWEAKLHAAHEGWEATRDASDETHERLGETLTELGRTRNALQGTQTALQASQAALQEVQTQLDAARTFRTRALAELDILGRDLGIIRSTYSYRIGARLRALLPWKRHSAEEVAPISPREATSRMATPHYRPCTLPAPLDGCLPHVAVHVHIHYTELLDELLDAVSHIPQPFDLFVTTTQPVQAVEAEVLARVPGAKVWQCPNQGKDIGPFVNALTRFRLDKYDLVLKLHGKKSNNQPSYIAAIQGLFGKDIKDGDDWRRKLISPIAGSAERVLRIYRAFAENPGVAMLGAAQFICKAPDADIPAYIQLCKRLNVSTDVLFFGGTMFWIRGAALTRLIEAGITQADFDPTHQASVESTLEHACERVFGALAAASGGELVGVNDLSS